MLRQQHQFAAKITNSCLRQEYQMHMCGLCCTLGQNYGLPYRLLTSHEMILLNMLTNAQRLEDPIVVNCRCPLNPLKTVRASRGVASEFASSAAIGLAKVSVEDKVQDSKWWNISWRLLNWILGDVYLVALENLANIGFEAEVLTQLTALQTDVQASKAKDPARPTATTTAKLFTRTAYLAGNSRNEDVLAEIGLCYGEYIYLMDALRDYPEDMQRGNYNPLHRFSKYSGNLLILSREGLEWLLERFASLLSVIQSHFVHLQVYRHRDVLGEMFYQPIESTIAGLSTRIDRDERLVFWRWQYTDALKAAAFVMPMIVVSAKEIDSNIVNDTMEHLPPGIVSDSCNVVRTGAESAQLSIIDIIGKIDWLSRILDPMHLAAPSLCEACAQDCTNWELYESACECATADDGCNLI